MNNKSILSKDKLWNKIKRYIYYIIILLFLIFILLFYLVIYLLFLNKKINYILKD